MPASSASNPPYSRIRAQIAETKTVTTIVSNIPEAPVPIFERSEVKCVLPVKSIMIEPETMPIKRTAKTFTPKIPPIKTRI